MRVRETRGMSQSDAPAFAVERHAHILQLLHERGRVRNTELADLLGVTEPTIRKDIADLARQQQLRRTHGGAIALRTAIEPDMPARMGRNIDAKSRIAHACLALVKTGDAIFLDSGSTTLAIAEQLVPAAAAGSPANVNVLTNALAVAQTLADKAGIRHTVLGGNYRPTGGCFVGPLTQQDLNSFTVNLAFLGVTGVTDQGFTVADLSEAQVKRAAMDRARRVVVVMDSTKVGATDFATVCELDAVATIVTDESNDHLAALCTAAGVELIVAAADVIPTDQPRAR